MSTCDDKWRLCSNTRGEYCFFHIVHYVGQLRLTEKLKYVIFFKLILLYFRGKFRIYIGRMAKFQPPLPFYTWLKHSIGKINSYGDRDVKIGLRVQGNYCRVSSRPIFGGTWSYYNQLPVLYNIPVGWPC